MTPRLNLRSTRKIHCVLTILLLLIGCDLGIHPVPQSEPDTYACDRGTTLFGGGSGTATNPYKICTRAHLTAIAGAYLGSHFIQMQDIDLGGIATPFDPIGSSAGTGFTGTYNGNSKTISNLYFNTLGYFKSAALFSFVDSGGVVKNVTLTGVNITADSQYTGSLIALANGATVQNCSSSGVVNGDMDTGGLIGAAQVATTITSSSSSATVNGTNVSVGGLVGSTDSATISASSATGSVSGTNQVGGLVGYLVQSTISSSFATGVVNGTDQVGGLVGYGLDTTATLDDIQNSYATGAVIGAGTQIGGLMGFSDGIDATSSHATGNVTGDSSVGGLVGDQSKISSNVFITSCYATGTVTGTTGSVGGLVGYVSSGVVHLSYATGNVVAGAAIAVGGLIGLLTNGEVQNCYATGSVTGDLRVGGAFGLTNFGATIDNSYSVGAVTGNGSVGGFGGRDDGSTVVTSCYWDTITSGQVASMIGSGLNTAQMKAFANFTGWDFATIWNGAGFGGSAAVYPFLR